jgi:hypothetical protein
MNTKAIAQRVVRLERAASAASRAWAATLTDAELDEYYNAIPAHIRATYDGMTDAELERLATGRMSRVEWQRHQQRQ